MNETDTPHYDLSWLETELRQREERSELHLNEAEDPYYEGMQYGYYLAFVDLRHDIFGDERTDGPPQVGPLARQQPV